MALKTSIQFGMVYIPVKLHLSIKENEMGFNMLDKETMSRVKYVKTCVDCNGREVKQADIVKGYQYEKDKYVIFHEDDFEKIKADKDKNITIDSFVDLKDIDPIYYAKTYYVEPVGGERAFNLLITAMEQEKKAGIAKTVLGNKETLSAIRVHDGILIMNTLYFDEEVQRPNFSIPKAKVDDKELKLAKMIIEGLKDKFIPEKYHDDYSAKLQAAIEAKIHGKDITVASSDIKRDTAADLMKALENTLANIDKNEGKPSLPSKKTTKRSQSNA